MDFETSETFIDATGRDQKDELLRVYAEWRRALDDVNDYYGAIIARLTEQPVPVSA